MFRGLGVSRWNRGATTSKRSPKMARLPGPVRGISTAVQEYARTENAWGQ